MIRILPGFSAGLVLAALVVAGSGELSAGTIHVAVASNFGRAFEEIAERFEVQTGHQVILSLASTGKHYAQIRNGAPFQAFFAADVERPRRLEDEGLALPGSRLTYALGKLVLWSPRGGYVDGEGAVLEGGDFRFLSLANPELAPYGRAARQVLEARGLWQTLQSRIVRGENIGQAFQFVDSGNAELGFVALSQILRPGESIRGSWWEVPQALYGPIEQQAVLLAEDPVAREFLTFMGREEVAAILRAYGYEYPR